MEVLQFTPKTSITAQTMSGDTYDLTGDLYNWSSSKSMPNGTFTINLVARTNSKGQTWADILGPMTYIEIRASKNGTKVNGQLPIIMRGFLDGPLKSTQFGQTGGPSEPRISLAGQDYTKILNQWQILYLFTQNTFKKGGNISGIAAQQLGFGLFANFSIPIFSKSINDYMGTLYANILNPALKGIGERNYPNLPNMSHAFTFPNYPINGLTIASYTGSFYNLFQYVSSPPFGELFIREGTDGPVLVGRQTPYKTITGKTPAYGSSLANEGAIHGVTSINVQQTDQDLYTYFLTTAADAQIVGPSSMPTFIPGLSNGVLTDKASLFGTIPLEVSTPWVSLASTDSTSKTNVLKLASDLNSWLIATMGDNHLFWNGSVNCHGDESLEIGTYRTVGDMEFYVTQIQDEFNYVGNTWTATVEVTRGWKYE